MSRFRDEQLDAEDIPSAFHFEDLVHPCADPFERFGVGYAPDEQDLLRRADAGLVLEHQVVDIANAVSDANASGEEDNGAVR